MKQKLKNHGQNNNTHHPRSQNLPHLTTIDAHCQSSRLSVTPHYRDDSGNVPVASVGCSFEGQVHQQHCNVTNGLTPTNDIPAASGSHPSLNNIFSTHRLKQSNIAAAAVATGRRKSKRTANAAPHDRFAGVTSQMPLQQAQQVQPLENAASGCQVRQPTPSTNIFSSHRLRRARFPADSAEHPQCLTSRLECPSSSAAHKDDGQTTSNTNEGTLAVNTTQSTAGRKRARASSYVSARRVRQSSSKASYSQHGSDTSTQPARSKASDSQHGSHDSRQPPLHISEGHNVAGSASGGNSYSRQPSQPPVNAARQMIGRHVPQALQPQCSTSGLQCPSSSAAHDDHGQTSSNTNEGALPVNAPQSTTGRKRGRLSSYVTTRRVRQSCSRASHQQHGPQNSRQPSPHISEDASPTYIHLGDCNERFRYCDATFWRGERLKGHSSSGGQPKYNLCCGGGKIFMEPETYPPAYIRHLLADANFMQHIRAYNQMFAMTSFGANIDDAWFCNLTTGFTSRGISRGLQPHQAVYLTDVV